MLCFAFLLLWYWWVLCKGATEKEEERRRGPEGEEGRQRWCGYGCQEEREKNVRFAWSKEGRSWRSEFSLCVLLILLYYLKMLWKWWIYHEFDNRETPWEFSTKRCTSKCQRVKWLQYGMPSLLLRLCIQCILFDTYTHYALCLSCLAWFYCDDVLNLMNHTIIFHYTNCGSFTVHMNLCDIQSALHVLLFNCWIKHLLPL